MLPKERRFVGSSSGLLDTPGRRDARHPDTASGKRDPTVLKAPRDTKRSPQRVGRGKDPRTSVLAFPRCLSNSWVRTVSSRGAFRGAGSGTEAPGRHGGDGGTSPGAVTASGRVGGGARPATLPAAAAGGRARASSSPRGRHSPGSRSARAGEGLGATPAASPGWAEQRPAAAPSGCPGKGRGGCAWP